MDSQRFSENKRNIIRQLSDRFNKISLTKIRYICEECQWNVDLCIDKLKTTDGSGQEAQSVIELPAVYDKVYDSIGKGYKVLILMRGCPGSGKSTLAKSIANRLMAGTDWKEFLISADDFRYDSQGRYKFSTERLDDAHKYCQARAREKAALGWSPIIIDNTNIKLSQMVPYVKAAVENGYIVEMMEPVTPWRWSLNELVAKNTHKVPRQAIKRMLDSYESGTPSDVMSLANVQYAVSLPQFRSIPPPPAVEPQPQAQ